MNSSFPVLENIPIFSLLKPTSSEINFKKVFKGWPAERLAILDLAQRARDVLVKHLDQKLPPELCLDDIARYLPLALTLENEVKVNPNLNIDTSLKFHWKQSPIVISNYQDRYFSGNFMSVEVLHVLWLRAILLLNGSASYAAVHEYEKAIQFQRELAGVFNFLSADRLRVIMNETVPIEFQPPVFQSLAMLALSQVYSLIASKAERDHLKPLSLCKLCYTSSRTLKNALEALAGVTRPKSKDIIHKQYQDWLQGTSSFYFSVSAILASFHHRSKDEVGKAISLARLAVAKLNQTLSIPRLPENIQKPAKEILRKFAPIEKEWSEFNADVTSEYVPTMTEAESFIAVLCTTIPNLPQPIPFQLPEMFLLGISPDPFTSIPEGGSGNAGQYSTVTTVQRTASSEVPTSSNFSTSGSINLTQSSEAPTIHKVVRPPK